MSGSNLTQVFPHSIALPRTPKPLLVPSADCTKYPAVAIRPEHIGAVQLARCDVIAHGPVKGCPASRPGTDDRRLCCTFNLSEHPMAFSASDGELIRAGNFDEGLLGPYAAPIEEIE